jgi:putative membrane protein
MGGEIHINLNRRGGLMMDGYGFEHGFGLGHGFGILFWILIVVLLVAAVAFVLRGAGSGSAADKRPSREKSALEILEARYARGEIGHDEFEQRKRNLQDREGSP